MDASRVGALGEPLISATEARAYIAQRADDADFVLLDVRTAEEIEEAHIPGVLRLDIIGGEFQQRVENLDRERDYLLVCRSGNRSGYAVAMMLQLGFRRAVNMEGGMLAWLRQGYAVEEGAVEAG
jgi:rhodanese-related sulfurtransferase